MENHQLILRAWYSTSRKKWLIEARTGIVSRLHPAAYIEGAEFDFWKDAEKFIDVMIKEQPEKFKRF